MLDFSQKVKLTLFSLSKKEQRRICIFLETSSKTCIEPMDRQKTGDLGYSECYFDETRTFFYPYFLDISEIKNNREFSDRVYL